MATEDSGKKATQTGDKVSARTRTKVISKKEMYAGQSPIIVTGGSCTMTTSIYQFQAPDKQKTRKFDVITPDGGTAGKIVGVTIRDGDTLYETVTITQPKDCVIEIIYET